MADSEKINLAQLRERYPGGLRIPEIQRDYVMGAGGKRNKTSKDDKLTALLDAILEKCKAGEDFDFSSIIAYCEKDECGNAFLNIYDGQQRLTTLLLLILYKLRREEFEETRNGENVPRNVSYRDFKDWYRFSERPTAQEILTILTEESGANPDKLVKSIEVRDFTSFSMEKLLKKISGKDGEKYKCITCDYLLQQVKFDKVEMDSQSEIEQLFMDLNSGVKMKEYELYKAKLIHHIGKIGRKCSDEDRKKKLDLWAYKIDNEWLNAFKPFASFSHPAEEYEMAFIEYCFHMTWLCKDRGMKEEKDGIGHLNEDLLEDAYSIMESVSGLDFVKIKADIDAEMEKFIDADSDVKNYLCGELLHYSWGDYKNEKPEIRKCNYDKRGVAYNLKFDKHDKQLCWVIENILLSEKKKEMHSDAVLWCYISTLIWRSEHLQNEYLRLVKILLNNNYVINEVAWYECQKKGQYMYYCRNIVCGIPQYYGKHGTYEDIRKKMDSNMGMTDYILSSNACIVKNTNADELSDRKKMTFHFTKLLLDSEGENTGDIVKKRINIISERKSYIESYQGTYSEYLEGENSRWGIGNPVTLRSDKPYVAKVDLRWPIRNNKESVLKKCWIRMQGDMNHNFWDFGYQDLNTEKMGLFIVGVLKSKKCGDPSKCFWVEDCQNTYMIRDRKDSCRTTYIAYGKEEWDSSLGKYVSWKKVIQ